MYHVCQLIIGYLSAKDEGNQFSKHVPHFRDFTRSSGTFSLISLVTQPSFPQTAVSGKERCVTRLKTAARKTKVPMAEKETSVPICHCPK